MEFSIINDLKNVYKRDNMIIILQNFHFFIFNGQNGDFERIVAVKSEPTRVTLVYMPVFNPNVSDCFGRHLIFVIKLKL